MTDTPADLAVYRTCKHCGKPFQPTRLDTARYCSTLCRVKAWQARKRDEERATTDKGDA